MFGELLRRAGLHPGDGPHQLDVGESFLEGHAAPSASVPTTVPRAFLGVKCQVAKRLDSGPFRGYTLFMGRGQPTHNKER